MPHMVFALSITVTILVVTAIAPFPPEHPYNRLNPLIDPWWERLDKKTRKEVYSVWTQYEPFLLALAKADEILTRKSKVGIEKVHAFEALGAAKIKKLKSILKGEKLVPDVEIVSSLILREPRGATLSVPCWNLPSLYKEPRTDYYRRVGMVLPSQASGV